MATEVRREQLEVDSSPGRILVATTVLGSSVVLLTTTVVNVAIPALARDLSASSAEQQWVVNAYLLPLAALILVGGSLGDRYGRRRLYRIGVSGFAAASIACAVAPTFGLLVVARFLQGVGGALLMPGSLAIIEASIRRDDRTRAVGLWAGWSGIGAAVGPLLGGLLVELSWRWVFVLNVPIAVAVMLLSLRIPESRDDQAVGTSVDWLGAGLAILALGALSFGLVEGPAAGFGTADVAALLTALIAAAGLWFVERRVDHAIVPIDLFSDRMFVGANTVTLLVYAGLGLVFFMLSIQLQVGAGWSPIEAGAALLPVTVIMLALSSRIGEMAKHVGPRIPLTVGPVVMGVGMLLLVRVDASATFLGDVLPATCVFGLGLAISVTPVTATALGAVPDDRSGAASGTNNAVARTGQLLAIAAIPPLVGLTGDALSDPASVADRYGTAMVVAAALVVAGAAAAFALFRPEDVIGAAESGETDGESDTS